MINYHLSGTMKLGSDIVILPSVDSTNIYAMEQVHAHMATHGKVYFALEQTAGKGQRGKQWFSAVGKNIMASAVYAIDNRLLDTQFLFSSCIAMGCYDFYNLYAVDEVSIKWPNDIYWRDRKAGGILIENIIQAGLWKWSIAGIGLNINQTDFDPDIARKPVSLKQITGKELDLMDLTRSLCYCLEIRWQQFKQDPQSLLQDLNKVLYRKGSLIKLKKGNRLFDARLEGVDEMGRLVVFSSMEERFIHGAVEML